jgi:hypothetical protein
MTPAHFRPAAALGRVWARRHCPSESSSSSPDASVLLFLPFRPRPTRRRRRRRRRPRAFTPRTRSPEGAAAASASSSSASASLSTSSSMPYRRLLRACEVDATFLAPRRFFGTGAHIEVNKLAACCSGAAELENAQQHTKLRSSGVRRDAGHGARSVGSLRQHPAVSTGADAAPPGRRHRSSGASCATLSLKRVR